MLLDYMTIINRGEGEKKNKRRFGGLSFSIRFVCFGAFSQRPLSYFCGMLRFRKIGSFSSLSIIISIIFIFFQVSRVYY